MALDPGADRAAVRARLERAVADRPDVVVHSLQQYLEGWLLGAMFQRTARHPAGKVLEHELRRPYWEGMGRQVN